jgi:predicted DNA-binding transcriptional regulator YafY
MTKSERLLEIIRILHKRKYAVTAKKLSEEFGVSIRTVYRDILSLQYQGIPIDGEAGVGYLLGKDYTLPPLMLTIDEVEALVVGAKWVVSTGDATLAESAVEAIRKIKDVLPPTLRRALTETPLVIGHKTRSNIDTRLSKTIHDAMRREQKLRIRYVDKNGDETDRVIWPIALGFFDDGAVIAAWCELRNSFRHFRIDRIRAWSLSRDRYPGTHRLLYERWLDDQDMEDTDL